MLDRAGEVKGVGWAGTDAQVLEAIRQWHPCLVAIDAPLTLPLGLHCLEGDCPCRPLSPRAGRECERALRREGVLLYYPTKRTPPGFKALVYRGMALRRALEGEGYPVIEVYPYATKVRLFGRRLPKKTRGEAGEFYRQRMAGRVKGLERYVFRLDHHGWDALLAAYTAFLHLWGQTEPLGVAEEGHIVLPLRR